MTSLRRTILILMMTVAGWAAAQETTATTTAAAETTTAVAAEPERRSSDEIRTLFSAVIRRSPPELGSILRLDPTLLSDQAFLARYPELAQFVAAHPEVRHHPRFYLAEFEYPIDRRTLLDELLEMVSVGFVFVLIVSASVWLVRTIIEQRRWNRLSRTQAEVHNKILDRFGTTEDLLAYIRTPAGTKFLESAPIPLHSERTTNAPMTRVLWSIQIGVVVAVAAIGMLLVSGRFDKETAQGLYALGMIGLALGIGFVASAAVSLFLSRRLGLLEPPRTTTVDEAGLVK